MNKIFNIILLIVLAIPAQAWFWDKSLNDYKDDFRNKVLEVKEQKTETNTELSETKKLIFDFANLLQKSKKEDVDFGVLHDKWLDTESEIKHLQTKFVSLVESADTYFNQTKIKADEISDKKLKASVIKKITTSENKYIIQLKNANKRLVELGVGNRKLKDIITFLEISNSLKSLDKELNDRFSEVDAILNVVMKDLDTLHIESQELLNEEI